MVSAGAWALFAATVISAVILVNYWSLLVHETTHLEIYEAYGCKNASYETPYFGLLGGTARCDKASMDAQTRLRMDEKNIDLHIAQYETLTTSTYTFAAVALLWLWIAVIGKNKEVEEK